MTREGWHEEHKQMAVNVCRRLKPIIDIVDGEPVCDYSNVVPFDVKQRVFMEADGFGPMSLTEIEDTEYDWSHVRDSTLGAFIRMNVIIETWDEYMKPSWSHSFDWWVVAHDRVQKIREQGF